VMLSLAAFQSGLGRALRGENICPVDPGSPGFRFTASVRRSWCEGRAMVAARTVLKLVPEPERRRLVAEYIDAGGGLEMFLPAENEAFLRFLEPRLPGPSHPLSLCRMDRALTRARLGAETFQPPGRPGGLGHSHRYRIERGPHAALVWFHADPGAVLKALDGAPSPPVGEPTCPMLFAPGLPRLYRVATPAEAALWAVLPKDDVSFDVVEPLLAEGAVIRTRMLDRKAFSPR
jgi:hypothetical protein